MSSSVMQPATMEQSGLSGPDLRRVCAMADKFSVTVANRSKHGRIRECCHLTVLYSYPCGGHGIFARREVNLHYRACRAFLYALTA